MINSQGIGQCGQHRSLWESGKAGAICGGRLTASCAIMLSLGY